MVTTCQDPRAVRERIKLVVASHDDTGASHYELAALARYCVARIERELGELGAWVVRVGPGVNKYTSTIAVTDGERGTMIVASGHDGALAIWDAMCRIERRLRETSARRIRREVDVGQYRTL